MNNNQRNDIDTEELKQAEEMLRVLESGQCQTTEDSQMHELGRLLRQSASHDLPESSESLREQLLAELDGDAAPVAPLKTPAPRQVDRAGRKRMWMGLAVAALIAVGGWSLFSGQFDSMAQRSLKEDPKFKRERAEQHNVNEDESRKKLFSLQDGDELVADRLAMVPEVTSNSVQSHDQSDNGAQPQLADSEQLVREKESLHKWTEELKEVKREHAYPKLAMADQQGQGQGQGQQQGEGQQQGMQQGQGEQQGQGQGQQGRQLGLNQLNGQNKSMRYEDLAGVKTVGAPGQQQGQQGQGGERSTELQSLFIAPAQQGEKGQGQMQLALRPAPAAPKSEGWSYRRGVEADSKLLAKKRATTVTVPDGGTVLAGGVKLEKWHSQDGVDHFAEDYYESESRFSREDLGRGFGITVESKSGEQYTPIHENEFVQAVGGAAISTFSIDVDTASYANMRRFLSAGQRPPRDSVRIEELVNYFQYNYPQPKGEDPFSVNMELATCPWNEAHKLLRVGLKGKEIHVKERPATNVVYLIDVSGSMNSPAKLPLLKTGFQMMTKQLGENDRVSIVTYAGNAGVALEPTTGNKTRTINEAIERLTPGGSTHGSAGIELAYKLAQQNFIAGGVNKVILATDGDLNVGVTDDDSLVKLIKQKASEGVFLTVLGFGTGNLKDGKLEKIADNGNGHYAYIDSNREAHRVLVQQMSGSLVTIAKDVKIQIEFNPAEVECYRLIGYENRMLATKDFDDDQKDAGEIGAGHTVTAIYEILPTGSVAGGFVAPEGMKYQIPGAETPKKVDDDKLSRLSEAASSGELATVALRYKKPDENKSKRIEFAIKNEDKSFTSASEDFRFAASVAGFGMLLRGSQHAGDATPKMILEMASESVGSDETGYRAEFVDLVRKACFGQ